MKRAVIVHGYKGKPETNWKPWLKAELEANGYAVTVPAMPEAEQPIARAWHDKLTETVGQPDADVYLIGHSLGCITILRYLESLPENQKVGGVVLVAGFGERFAQYQAGNHDTFLITSWIGSASGNIATTLWRSARTMIRTSIFHRLSYLNRSSAPKR